MVGVRNVQSDRFPKVDNELDQNSDICSHSLIKASKIPLVRAVVQEDGGLQGVHEQGHHQKGDMLESFGEGFLISRTLPTFQNLFHIQGEDEKSPQVSLVRILSYF